MKARTTFYEDLAHMLRVLRTSCGFTQRAVAEALGVNRSTYSYYELGRATPDMVTLKALSRIFAVSPEEFFYPERYHDTEPANRRQDLPKAGTLDLGAIKDLSEEEQCLLAQFRVGELVPLK